MVLKIVKKKVAKATIISYPIFFIKRVNLRTLLNGLWWVEYSHEGNLCQIDALVFPHLLHEKWRKFSVTL